jgi:hypothetical protein
LLIILFFLKKVEYLKSQKKKLNIANEPNAITVKQQVIINKDGKFQGEGRRMDGKAIDAAKLQLLNVLFKFFFYLNRNFI